MLQFYGEEPPAKLLEIEVGGHCPHCKTGTKFIRSTMPDFGELLHNTVSTVIIDYFCSICRKSIPIKWRVLDFLQTGDIAVADPVTVVPAREPFNFDHVPDNVRREIEEALDCLSVNAYNAFAALCRRAIQAICTNLGGNATTRVKEQIDEMIKVTGLTSEWEDLVVQIMLSGHDGAHPHLPEMNGERARVLLPLLQDLTYELYTRPGKVRESMSLRQKAIAAKKTNS